MLLTKVKENREGQNHIDVLQEENYLSSEHECEDDLIRNIVEENDDIYEEINYIEPYWKIKNDPGRLQFLQDFQDDLDK